MAAQLGPSQPTPLLGAVIVTMLGPEGCEWKRCGNIHVFSLPSSDKPLALPGPARFTLFWAGTRIGPRLRFDHTGEDNVLGSSGTTPQNWTRSHQGYYLREK